MHTVDTRGLSCPQPLVMVHELLRDNNLKELDVLVDNAASQENISRAASKQGFGVTALDQADDVVKLELRRG